MKSVKPDKIIKLAIKAARAAGTIIIANMDDITVDFKKSNDMVTNSDRMAEDAIVRIIKNIFPEHSFLCEEAAEKDAVFSENLWIIDPLDGTNNYARKIPQFCVSIAYAEKGEVLAGVVYDPCRKELFTAINGRGSCMNNKPICVSDTRELNKSVVATGFYYDRGEIMERTLKSIHSLFIKKICGFRRMGSAALDLCWVACGRYDGYFEYMLSPWDYAAGMLILREARGTCLDRYGTQKTLSNTGIIAHNSILDPGFVEIVRY